MTAPKISKETKTAKAPNFKAKTLAPDVNVSFTGTEDENATDITAPVDDEVVTDSTDLTGDAVDNLEDSLDDVTEDEKPEDEVVVTVVPEVTFAPKLDTVVPERLVKICMRRDHSCNIGGEQYNLLKDKTYNVPENVKRILSKADLTKAL